ncbi:MAG TPA: hypothetical protein PKL82_07320, partial [Anaerolineaceae bacterium]|nr:hypothetical protein [Anaerolineaceae bacterium]
MPIRSEFEIIRLSGKGSRSDLAYPDRHVAALLAVRMGFVIASPRDKNHRDLDLEEGGAAICPYAFMRLSFST